jgi:hypothetical protein
MRTPPRIATLPLSSLGSNSGAATGVTVVGGTGLGASEPVALAEPEPIAKKVNATDKTSDPTIPNIMGE